MKKLIVALVLVSGAGLAQETDRPVVVISTAGGASAGSATAGGEVGVFNDSGRLRYGVSALVTGGSAIWAGALLGARWSLIENARFTPYVGVGLGAFSAQRSGLDLGVQPTASFEAGVSYWRLFAGARMLLPLSTHTGGVRPHDEAGFGDPAVLGQVGFRI